MIRRLWRWWCVQAMGWQLWASLALNAAYQTCPQVRRVLPPPDYAIQLVLHGSFHLPWN